ncbi:uncharacterized protein LOC128167970 [Crassostrea angulata]|uniref:Uncharacterized protein n=1 Tax=Magallana gigas TaxID=29159 RepID=A0A8W8L406_MAGGI|nr:uncharacterized protein LOC105347451 [Crassostrea gigas]XP_052689960.1 uncharacterized protein LOC128167970 [Crassostrea angulata]
MGLFEYLTRNNKVGVMMDEKEAYDKVRRTTVLKKVAEKNGPTSTSEGAPKIQPRRLSDESKGTEKRKKSQGMTMARKKKLAKQRREEGLTFRNRLKNCDY